jgi:hypothetical protein
MPSSALALVEGLESFRGISEQDLSEHDPEYWAGFHRQMRDEILTRLKAGSRPEVDLLQSDVDSLLLRMQALELKHFAAAQSIHDESADVVAQSQLPENIDQPSSEDLLMSRELASRFLNQFRQARQGMLALRQHFYFPQPYAVNIERDGSVTLKEKIMIPNIPYIFEVGGETMVAVKTGEMEVDIYDLPNPLEAA